MVNRRLQPGCRPTSTPGKGIDECAKHADACTLVALPPSPTNDMAGLSLDGIGHQQARAIAGAAIGRVGSRAGAVRWLGAVSIAPATRCGDSGLGRGASVGLLCKSPGHRPACMVLLVVRHRRQRGELTGPAAGAETYLWSVVRTAPGPAKSS